MRFRSFILVAALGAVGASARAQGGTVNPYCQNTTYVGPAQAGGDACQKVVDTFGYTSQQYAMLLSAGNLEIGRADALGAFPRFRVALHVTGMNVTAPAFRESGIHSGPATSTTVPTQSTDYATVSADGVLGLFGGFNLGLVTIGAVDAYASANIVPGASASGYSITPKSKFYLAWGGRVGVLQEGKVIPGVGVSYLVRNMPKTTVVGSDATGNVVTVSDLALDTHAWSVTAGKHFGVVSLVLGGGQTTFTSAAQLSWSVNLQNPPSPIPLSITSTQTDYFGDFGLSLGSSVHLAVEIGQVSGSQVQTFNTFDPASSATRSFASVALAFGY